jgi:competence protein ComEA
MLDFIYKKRTLIGALLVLVIVVGAGLLIYASSRQKEGMKTDDNSTSSLIIDIEGAVKKPGIYELNPGSLMQDIIEAAGGLAENADLDKIAKELNRAELLKNNQKIYIPAKIVTESVSTVAGTNISNKININLATVEELDTLPGIGSVYAQRIINYRKNKPFRSIEEIMEIEGIGEKTFEKLKDLVII